MKNVKFISAGAGSGKTYSLTQQIVEFIESGVCSADEIILTTFTRAAASELLEKVRSALYNNGLYDAATQIDNAAIGTIHSIAYQIVSRYWYLLGISADVRMIDEEAQKLYVMQSLSSLPNDGDLHIFREMQAALNITKYDGDQHNRPNHDFWRSDLQNIIDKINNYCLDDEDLERAKELSKRTIAEVLRTNTNTVNLEEVLENAERIKQATSGLKRGNQAQKRNNIEKLINAFKKDCKKTDATTLNVCAYIQLKKGLTNTNIKTVGLGESCQNEYKFFDDLPDRILSDHRTYNLFESYINCIFRLAQEWHKRYDEFKKERRLLDFNDVLRHFAELLDNPDVTEELQSRYKIALVDEFQDCSPQQVAFFKRLSELMRQSVWVGDIKQAIYGFRGTDTEQIKSVIDEIAGKENGNTLDKLKHCWRSSETIVTLANDVFCKAFDTLPKELITLKMPEDNGRQKPAERELQHWHFKVGKAEERRDALAYQIRQLHESQHIEYKDIAVLCRNNDEVSGYATALDKLGIPNHPVVDSNNGTGKGEGNAVFDFLTAMVSVAANANNRFSRALVAYYTEPGYTASKILSERLRSIESDEANKWLSDVSMLKRIDNISRTIGSQSVASAVETLVVELNAADIIKRISAETDAYGCCQVFVGAAKRYEEQCNNLGLGCSLAGFVDYVKHSKLSQTGDENGVTVSTYHKSKGLEWKCVVLCSLDDEPVPMKKVFFGVNVACTDGRRNVMLIPGGLAAFYNDLKTRIEKHYIYKALAKATLEEAKRLMYVGMTRPKELLITTSAVAKSGNRTTEYDTKWLDQITGCDVPAMNCAEESFNWFGHDFRYSAIDYDATEQDAATPAAEQEVEVMKMPDTYRSYEPRDIQPSRVSVSERLQSVEVAGTFSERLNARATDGNDATLGNCIHHLMCIWRDDADFAATAARLAAEYGVMLDTERFMASARAFYAWLKEAYGEPLAIEREVPFRYVRDDGRIVNGEIDMIYRTSDGDVLIDYKTYSGVVGNLTAPGSEFYAGKYSGQIEVYEETLRRNGRSVRDRIVCYFSLGTMVRMNYN